MHFSIPFTQERVDSFGTRYVLYSLYLEGFPFCKVRYSDLHKWHEQLRRKFGSSVPPFPPKFYLAMTKPMAEERRSQLEHYLQSVGSNPTISSSELFIHHFKDVQMDTCKIQEQKTNMDIYLPNGKKTRIEVQTSDTAERVLEIVAHKLELHREFTQYFSLFLIQSPSTVLKRMVEFELPYVTLCRMKDTDLILEIRKWYMDPSMDKMLFDSQASVTLLYLQALKEIDRQWSRPTREQLKKLQDLEKAGHHIKFLELMQNVQQYGCIQLDSCIVNCLGPDCEAVVSVGNDEMHCNIQLSNYTTKHITYKTNSIRCWQVTFLGPEVEDQGHMNDQKLELRFEYGHRDSWKWITICTKQAFLLSSCLQKMFTENLLKQTKASLEMQIEVPQMTKAKKSIKAYNQMAVHFGKNEGKVQFSSEENERNNFVEIEEDDL